MDIDIFELQSGFGYKMSGSGIQLMGGIATLHRISSGLQLRASNAVLQLRGATSRLVTTVIAIKVGRYWSLPYNPHSVL